MLRKNDNLKNNNGGKPLDDVNKFVPSSNSNEESPSSTSLSKPKELSKDLGKKTFNNALEEKADDGYMAKEAKKDIKKTRKAINKTKKAVRNTKRAFRTVGNGIRTLLALGPLGWFILFLILTALLSIGEAVAKDNKLNGGGSDDKLAPNVVEGLKPGTNTSDVLSGKDKATGGVSENNKKLVTLLVDCKPSKKSSKNR